LQTNEFPTIHRRFGRSLLAACVMAMLFSAAPIARTYAATLPDSGQFDETTTITATRLTVKIVKSITFKGNNYRIDSTRIDLVPYSRIKDNGTTYSYLPDEQTAMRQVDADKGVSLPSELLAQKNQFITGATKSGKETVAGFLCDIYAEPPQSDNNVSVKIWVSEDPKFPFVIKTQTTHHKEGITDTEEIGNVRLNALITEAAFALPKNTKVMDAPADDQTPGGPATGGQSPIGQTPDTQTPGADPTGNAPAGGGPPASH
jgi:outer membrane lipoprotein-sorting protein